MRRFKPAAGKRKVPEPPAAREAMPEPSQAPHVTPDGDAMAIVPVEEDADTQSDDGPMTKAKKRKGSNPAAAILACYVILPT